MSKSCLTIIIVLSVILLGSWLHHDYFVHCDASILSSPPIQPKAASITVPDDYVSIQEAVDNANEGDTVYIRNGTYFENVTVSKSLSIIGEAPSTTIIDRVGLQFPAIHVFNTTEVHIQNLTVNGAGLPFSPVIHIENTTKAQIRNLTVRNTSSSAWDSMGILALKANELILENCEITECYLGFSIRESTHCRIVGNRFVDNYAYGFDLRGRSTLNRFINNLISSNPTGINFFGTLISNNTFYRNNIINNINQVDGQFAGNTWDNGVEGNYWSDYQGVDSDGDGIGDTDNGIDRYPLIEAWNVTRIYLTDSYETVIKCNYTVASFSLNQSLKQLSFRITGPEGSGGFCNITIPKDLISIEEPSEKWLVMIGAEAPASIVEEDEYLTLIHFRYVLEADENRVRVKVSSLYLPTAYFEYYPTSPSIREPVNFTDVSIPSPNGTIEWRQWNFGDGSSEKTLETSVLHQFTEKSTFMVTLTVIDENNLTDSTSKTVTIRNLPPSADFNFLPTEPEVCEAVEFNASGSSDPEGNISQVQWDFGDGSETVIGEEVMASHLFEHAGTFSVNLTVYDSDGIPDSTTRNVTVLKGRLNLQLEASNETRLGHLLKVNASLINNCGGPVEAAQIEFHIYQNGEILSESAVTNTNGVARASFSLSQVGEYKVGAEYQGSNDYLEINTEATIIIQPSLTSMDILTEDEVVQGKKTTIYVILNDEYINPLSGIELELKFYNGTGWQTAEFSTTNQSGVASFSYVPSTAGQHIMKTVFEGTTIHAASEKEFALTAESLETDYTPFVLLGIILVAGSIVTFLVWKRWRTPRT